MVEISRYPHAHYSEAESFGYLALYYPYDAVKDGVLTKVQWRKQSWSPEILNYKEGKLESIRLFVTPFLQLIRHAANPSRETPAYLVPAPSSTSADSPKYSRRPWSDDSPRNRDDRNLVFCQELIKQGANIHLADFLTRTKSKPPKAKWSAEEHADSMKIESKNIAREIPSSPMLVIIDDVCTDGGTIGGCELVLAKRFKSSNIIKLTIGFTDDPHSFDAAFGV